MEPLELALKHINMADELLDELKKYKEKYKAESCGSGAEELNFRGLVSRVKSFPALMMDSGLVPAFTFYLSKVNTTEDVLKALYLYFSGKGSAPKPKDCKDKLIEEASKKESAGYSIAVAMLLSAMTKLKGYEFDDSDFLKSVVEKLRDLANKPEERLALEYSLGAYSIEMKKLVEAFSKAKWGSEE